MSILFIENDSGTKARICFWVGCVFPEIQNLGCVVYGNTIRQVNLKWRRLSLCGIYPDFAALSSSQRQSNGIIGGGRVVNTIVLGPLSKVKLLQKHIVCYTLYPVPCAVSVSAIPSYEAALTISRVWIPVDCDLGAPWDHYSRYHRRCSVHG